MFKIALVSSLLFGASMAFADEPVLQSFSMTRPSLVFSPDAPTGFAAYQAVAASIKPGMTMDDVRRMLPPPGKNYFLRSQDRREFGGESVLWMGTIFFMWYPLDDEYELQLTGYGGRDQSGHESMILTRTPIVVNKKTMNNPFLDQGPVWIRHSN